MMENLKRKASEKSDVGKKKYKTFLSSERVVNQYQAEQDA